MPSLLVFSIDIDDCLSNIAEPYTNQLILEEQSSFVDRFTIDTCEPLRLYTGKRHT